MVEQVYSERAHRHAGIFHEDVDRLWFVETSGQNCQKTTGSEKHSLTKVIRLA